MRFRVFALAMVLFFFVTGTAVPMTSSEVTPISSLTTSNEGSLNGLAFSYICGGPEKDSPGGQPCT